MSKLLHILLVTTFAAGVLAACSKEEAPAEAAPAVDAAPAAEAPAEAAPAAEAAAPSGPGGYEPTPEERVPGITEEPAESGS